MMERQATALSMSDADIHVAILNRQEEGLVALLRKHGARVRSVLLHRYAAASPEDVDEALWAAAHRVWQHIWKYDAAKLPLGSWFFVIARNALISALRVERAAPLVTSLDGGLLDVLERSELAERTEAQEKLLQALADCVDRLATNQKAIVLADLEYGASADGNALKEALGTSANSVYVSRNRAHRNIRKCLGSKGYR